MQPLELPEPTNENGMSENVRKCHGAETHLSEKQLIAIELMLIGHSVGDIALAVGVDPRTVFRWRRDERFRQELRDRRTDVWANSAERLVGLVEPALDVLRRQLGDRNERLRFRAANTILHLAKLQKAIERDELQKG